MGKEEENDQRLDIEIISERIWVEESCGSVQMGAEKRSLEGHGDLMQTLCLMMMTVGFKPKRKVEEVKMPRAEQEKEYAKKLATCMTKMTYLFSLKMSSSSENGI